MTRPDLADRLRGILRPSGRAALPPRPEAESVPAVPPGGSSLERVLGGDWRDTGHGPCFVVERPVEADATWGHARIGDLAESLERTSDGAAILAGGGPGCLPLVFFDLETTGLSGGAGTYAFLIGLASFDDRGCFVTRQYVMARHSDERALLATVADRLGCAGSLVSFNGKSFDAPVLETRYLFHRLEWIGARLPHLDVLHPARRFWGEFRLGAGPFERRQPDDDGAVKNSCGLSDLEREVLGISRRGDVPGFEIPARYFQFVRSGDARPLAAVLDHNRRDLLSLAALTARLLHLVAAGPSAARDAREALALGRLYGRAGQDGRASEAYERAAGECATGTATFAVSVGHGDASVEDACTSPIRIAALRALAHGARRARRYEESAVRWRQLLDVGGCPRHIASEAAEALAVHHEHRVRDLVAAKTFALRSLGTGPTHARSQAVHHRLARIERKLAGTRATNQMLSFG